MNPTAVISMGVFDGFHRGHATVIRRAIERSREARARLVVFTFEPHPDVVLRPGAPRARLSLPGERSAHLREAGVDEIRVLRFTQVLAATGPETFLVKHVFPFNRVAWMVVGYDFAMGRDRTGTIPVLRGIGSRFGFGVEGVSATEEGGAVVSSTSLRNALSDGKVENARMALGRDYTVTGLVVKGDGRGRKLGFPTANLEVSADKIRPRRGVYAVRVRGIGNHSLPGVVNVGIRPTFGGGSETVEVHLLDYSGDLVGKRLEIAFVSRLRSELKFKDAKELIGQIGKDIQASRVLLNAAPPDSIEP